MSAIPSSNISSVDSTVSPLAVTTSSPHQLLTGDIVTIASVGGTVEANGTWSIVRVSATAFTLFTRDGVPTPTGTAYTSGGTVARVDPGDIPANANTGRILSIKETTTTTGTGVVTLGGAVTGFAPFAVLGQSADVEYYIETVDGDGVATGTWEEGYGTFNFSLGTFTRTRVAKTSATAANTLEATAINFSAGTKHISAIATGSSSGAGGAPPVGGIVLAGGAGRPAINQGGPFDPAARANTGRIQVVRNIVSPGQNRDQGSGSLLYLMPFASDNRFNADTQFIDLFAISYTVGAAVTTTREWRRFPLTVPGATDGGIVSIDLNAASTHPFQATVKLPAQTRTRSGIPADVFVWVPAGSAYATFPRPQMFYLNWYSATARCSGSSDTNDYDSNDEGYRLTTSVNSDSSAWFLKLTGAPWMTAGSADLVAERFRYLGTVAGFDEDGIATNLPMKRGVWNYYNQMSYEDAGVAQAPAWDVNFWDWVRFAHQRYSAAESPFVFRSVYGEPKTGSNAGGEYPHAFTMRADSYGEADVKICSDITGASILAVRAATDFARLGEIQVGREGIPIIRQSGPRDNFPAETRAQAEGYPGGFLRSASAGRFGVLKVAYDAGKISIPTGVAHLATLGVHSFFVMQKNSDAASLARTLPPPVVRIYGGQGQRLIDPSGVRPAFNVPLSGECKFTATGKC